MKTFAYFDSGHEFPEEIVMAAGFSPAKILGDVEAGTGAADEYLHSYFCPFARSCLNQALATGKEWAGIGFAHGCDATNRHYDVWRRHIDNHFFWVNTPMKTDPTARSFHLRTLEDFKTALEKTYKLAISTENLATAISLSNKIKKRMRRLAAWRASRDIPNPDYFEMVRMAVQEPKSEVLDRLDELEKEWSSRPVFPPAMTPVLLTGSDVTFPGWMEVMEEAGLRVVRDDLSLGERYFQAAIPETIEPLKGLVEYYARQPQPATRVPADRRFAYLEKALWENELGAVVSQNLKFCEPYALDAPWMVEKFRQQGGTVIHLEREYTPTLDHQALTRLETFRQML